MACNLRNCAVHWKWLNKDIKLFQLFSTKVSLNCYSLVITSCENYDVLKTSLLDYYTNASWRKCCLTEEMTHAVTKWFIRKWPDYSAPHRIELILELRRLYLINLSFMCQFIKKIIEIFYLLVRTDIALIKRPHSNVINNKSIVIQFEEEVPFIRWLPKFDYTLAQHLDRCGQHANDFSQVLQHMPVHT